MATNKNATIRYQALDRCFANPGRRYYIEDLMEACSRALYDYDGRTTTVSRRMLFNDMDFMKSEAGFAAPIIGHRDGKRLYYRYADSDFSIHKQPINATEAGQLKTALEILGRFKGMPPFEFIPELTLKLRKTFALDDSNMAAIQFDHNEYLTNLDLLGPLFQHIQRREVLAIEYQPFSQPTPERYILHPYLLKQYNKRWFLFGQCEGFDSLTNLALDRIQAIQLLPNTAYVACAIDLEEYFEDIIGVSKPPQQPSIRVDIRVYRPVWPYIASKPIHPSQAITKQTEEWVDVKLDIIPNYEFYAVMLGYGDQVEILGPAAVRDGLKGQVERIGRLYG